MRMLSFSINSCLRNKRKAVLNFLICLITILLVNVFADNLLGIVQQMDRLIGVIPVDATISNLNGSLTTQLKIKEKSVDAVLDSKYLKNVALTIELRMGFGEFPVDDYIQYLRYEAAACTAIGSIPGLNETELTWRDGENCDTFFSSTEPICVMSKRMMEENDLEIGDQVTITVYYYRFAQFHLIYLEPLQTGPFTVVGDMEIVDYRGDGQAPSILFPFKTMRAYYHEHGLEFSAQAGSFEMLNPFDLNDMKQEMKQQGGFLPVSFQSDFQYDGNALTVRDETFVKASEQLLKSKNLMVALLPFLGLAILAIGFVMAQLLMKGRTAEYAIMRSLGQNHLQSIGSFFLEYGISAMVGCVVGVVVCAFLLQTELTIQLLLAAAFLLCYGLGMICSMASLKRLAIMSILSKST